MAGIELVSTPQPHYIPGYCGYCPQYRYRIGDTYGHQTHKLLLDPTVLRSEKMVLADRTPDQSLGTRPDQSDIDIVQSRFRYCYPAVFQHPMLPGYEGFVPRLDSQLGQSYTVSATEALSGFESQQARERVARNQLGRQSALQDGRAFPTKQEDMQLTQGNYLLPLTPVLPAAAGVVRSLPSQVKDVAPAYHSGESPYFMNCADPNKKLKPGFTGHVPYGYSRYGESYAPMTNSALCDFSSNYSRRQSTEWAPVSISRPDPPFLIQPTELYHRHVGMIPNYGGHIPGAQFRYGKTFGNDTRDGKRWLRGDFST